MLINELFDILKHSYDVDTTLIDKDTKIKDYLDSLDYLGFLIEVKKKYKLQFDSDDFPNLQTLNQVQELIEKHRLR